jgi:hypothetical protein
MVHEVPLLSCVAQRDTQCWKGMNDDTKAASITHFERIMLVHCIVYESRGCGNRSVSTKTKTLDIPSDNVQRDEETFDR